MSQNQHNAVPSVAYFVSHHPNHFLLVGVNSRNMIKYFSTYVRATKTPPQDFAFWVKSLWGQLQGFIIQFTWCIPFCLLEYWNCTNKMLTGCVFNSPISKKHFPVLYLPHILYYPYKKLCNKTCWSGWRDWDCCCPGSNLWIIKKYNVHNIWPITYFD